jgi:allantoinase
MKLPKERIDYSAIVDRKPMKLPGGARIVVWPIVNLEVWDITRPMARQVLAPPTGVTQLPDFPNWSWHEYGMRVGFWRFLKMFERFQIIPTLALNAAVCLEYPRVAGACKDAGWEFMGHSYVQGPIHQLEDQKGTIEKSLATIAAFTGKRPRGWLGPGLTQTYETPDLLTAAGIEYIGDWVFDDQPATLKTAHGPLVTLPYSLEQNDIPMMIVQHHRSEEMWQRTKDAFDRLYLEGAETARVLAIAIHPYISGVPHRIKYLEAAFEYMQGHEGVLFWTGERILDWYVKLRDEK